MCGRFLLTSPAEAIARRFALDVQGRNLRPRYNIAPGQEILVVRAARERGRRELREMRWGLWPSWMRETPRRALVNARVETAAERPAFRAAFRRRRCLVPADGWYEWQARGGATRQPFVLRLREERARPFAFAGIWETRPDPRGNGTRETVAILTMPAWPAFTDIHDRMPLVLADEVWDRWLDPSASPPRWPSDALRPVPTEAVEAWPVSRRVNRVANDDRRLIEPLAAGTATPPDDPFAPG